LLRFHKSVAVTNNRVNRSPKNLLSKVGAKMGALMEMKPTVTSITLMAAHPDLYW